MKLSTAELVLIKEALSNFVLPEEDDARAVNVEALFAKVAERIDTRKEKS